MYAWHGRTLLQWFDLYLMKYATGHMFLHDAFVWSQKIQQHNNNESIVVSLANTHISCYKHFASSIVGPSYIPNNNKVDQLKLSHKLCESW